MKIADGITKPRGRSRRRWLFRIGCGAVLLLLTAASLPFLMFGMPYVLGLTRWGASHRAYDALQAGDLEKALYWANRTIRIDPSFSCGYEVRGLVREANGEYEQAIEDFTNEIECSTPGSSAHVRRARVYEKMGKLDVAVADYRAAILRRTGGSSPPMKLAAERTGRAGDNLTSEYEFIDRFPADCRTSLEELVKLFDDAIKRHPDDKDLQTCRSWLLSGKEHEKRVREEKTGGSLGSELQQ